MDRSIVVGVDFDNTIINYDELLHTVAVERNLIPPDLRKSKRAIRDYIRQLPQGEIEWQKVQAVVYGVRIREARLIQGFRNFVTHCRFEKIPIYIISHKTEFAGYDETKTNLRLAALDWMAVNDFFDSPGLGFSKSEVFFGATRLEKIEYIRQLGCTHFVDDLEETFGEKTFPVNVSKILFASDGNRADLPNIQVASHWLDIYGYFFSA
jgi:hypothetical protein